MHILATLDFPPDNGGIQEYLYQQVRHRYTSDDLVLVPAHTLRPGQPEGLSAKVVPIRCPLSTRAIVILSLAGALKRRRGPGVHVECGNVFAALAARLAGCSYDVFTYGTELLNLGKNSLSALLLRWALKGATTRIVLGPYTHSLLTRAGIDGAWREEPPRLSLTGIAPVTQTVTPPFTILTLGRLVPHKGHDTIMRALVQLPPEWSLDIAGKGPHRQALQCLAQSLGIDNRIRFRGEVTDQEREMLFKKATALVLASREQPDGTEGFGIVLLEAMARGIPVAGSRCGGIPDVLDNGNCGHLFDPDNPDQLAQGLLEIVTEPELRSVRISRACNRLRTCYAWID